MVIDGNFIGYLTGKSTINGPSFAVFNSRRVLNLILNRLIRLVSELIKKEPLQLAICPPKITGQHHLGTISHRIQ